MKKRQNDSARASTLQITICVALLSASAILFASNFMPALRASQDGFYPPLPLPANSDLAIPDGVPGITVALPIDSIDADTVPTTVNVIEPVTTTLIDNNTTGGLNYVGFQGDFTYDSAVIGFVTSGALAPAVQGAGLTSDPNWNVSANVLNTGPGTTKTLRVSAFSTNFTPLNGAGTLYELRLFRVGPAGSSTNLVWGVSINQFIYIDDNLDTHTPTQTTGHITITGTPPSPSPSPTATATATGTPPPPPTLGNYPDTSIQLSSDITITPDAAPANATSINVSTSTNFKGKLEGYPATGVVRVTDAHPAGTYTITVRAFNAIGSTITRTFTLIVTTPVTCPFLNFINATNLGAGVTPNAVVVGDFNGDGNQDFAVANLDSANVSIFLGNGTGSFGGATNFSAGNDPYSLAVGDFNGDGRQDLAVANRDSGQVSILLGDGAGNFSAPTSFSVGITPRSVAVGDFNGDGKQDLATAGVPSVSILFGDGMGNFSAPNNFPVGDQPSSVAVGDFNGDGKQDLVTANNNSSNVSILLGDGTGNFSAPTNYDANGIAFSVTVADFNGDGKQDLAVTFFSSDHVSILLGNGDGSFGAETTFFSNGTDSHSLALCDFNGDGKQDVAVANRNPAPKNVSILLGNGAGNLSFAATLRANAGSIPQSVAVGDFNGDGKQDLVVANQGTNDVSVFIRTCGGQPPPTATPTATSTTTPAETSTPTATVASTATPSGTPGCPPVITQSTSQTIVPGNSISCNNGTGHTDNSYWRAFDMAAFTGGASYCVSSVSFGVESANIPQQVNVYLYTTSNFPVGFPGSLTLIGNTTLTVSSAQNGTVVTTPLSATVPAGTSQLVMELFTPNGIGSGGLFFVGSNTAPETDPSYIRAADCGVSTPTTMAALGFPNTHIVFNVNGSCGLCPTPSPTATATATSTATATATATSTATATATDTPTATATATCQDYGIINSSASIVPGTTDIGNHTDDGETTIALPFPISFYGNTYTTAYASANGSLSFANRYLFYAGCLPNFEFSYTIFPFATDQNTVPAGRGIFTLTTGSTPNRTFYIEWRNCRYLSATTCQANSNSNYEIVFQEGVSDFSIVYGTFEAANNTLGAIGVQGDYGVFTQSQCNSGRPASSQQTYSLCLPSTPTPTATATATPTATATGTPIPPTLGNYPDTALLLSADTTVTPDAAPTNTTSINVSTSTNFKGKLEGDPATGVVRVTDAHPIGTYTITVRAFHDGGSTATRTFTLTVTTPATCNPVSFAAAANFRVGPNPESVAVGDFNGDGKQDLVTANRPSGHNVWVLLGDGTGNFSTATTFNAGNLPHSVAVGDFNGDGKQDLAVANEFSFNVSILLGDGTGNFSDATNFETDAFPQSVAVGDFNGDGKQDIVTANYDPFDVSILLGDGAGNFSAPTNFGVGSYPVSVAVGDFNNDGKQDLAVANYYSNDVSILLGDGTGSFSAATDLGAGFNPESVVVGDFNSDGKQDLAVANHGGNNVSVFLGNGAGNFSAATNFGAGSVPRFVAVGDFNGDGKQDLAVVNGGSSSVSGLLGTGTGSFSAPVNFGVSGVGASSLAVGDFNSDNSQDLAVANLFTTSVSVLLRTCPGTPTPTATATATATAAGGTPAATPTPTSGGLPPTPTPTPTVPPATPSVPPATPTATPTPTMPPATATATATATSTATATATATSTATATATSTATATFTPTATATATETATATATATATSPATATATATATAATTPVATPTPSPAPAGCVFSHGYWQNHPASWCMETILVGCVSYTQAQAIAIMRHSSGQDKTYLLAQELIAAKLNVGCMGSDPNCVSSLLAAANAWLCDHPVGSGVGGGSVWNEIKATHAALEKYNTGRSCAPTCHITQ